MKRMHTTLYLLLAFALGVSACRPARDMGGDMPSQPDQIVAFTDVNVIPMDEERVLPGQTVVVENGRITQIGPSTSVSVPEQALRINGRGKYLMPGLAEMHGHIPPPDAPPAYVESVLFLYVANGITTVRGMLGFPNQLELRARANRGDLIALTLYLAGPGFSGGSVDSPEDAAQKVRQQKEQGWDLIKIFPGLTREEYDAIARTAQEVGMRFAGHVPADVGLIHALEMGQETFDHLDGYIEYLQGYQGPIDETQLADVVRRTREAGAWAVPTMALWETLQGAADLNALRQYPELRYMPPEEVQQWERAFEERIADSAFNLEVARRVIDNRMRLLKALQDGGVRILLGSDAPQQFSVPGFSIHREMERMANAGLTPYQILSSGTRNVGEYFKAQDAFGTITSGQRADLVLLDANPLEDVSHFSRRSGVMVRGRWLPERWIQNQLREIAAAYTREL